MRATALGTLVHAAPPAEETCRRGGEAEELKTLSLIPLREITEPLRIRAQLREALEGLSDQPARRFRVLKEIKAPLPEGPPESLNGFTRERLLPR